VATSAAPPDPEALQEGRLAGGVSLALWAAVIVSGLSIELF
jgi:hypothetical protein